MINLLVKILNLGNLGPSTCKTDQFEGDMRMRRSQRMNADPVKNTLLTAGKQVYMALKKAI
jgi:hypothetical protein